MSQDDRDELDEYTDEEEEDEGPAPTPFDHPLFLPGLLFAFMLWFGYDGWFNPEMKSEYIGFNRWGFGGFAVATAWYGYKGLQEMREDREAGSSTRRDDAHGG